MSYCHRNPAARALGVCLFLSLFAALPAAAAGKPSPAELAAYADQLLAGNYPADGPGEWLPRVREDLKLEQLVGLFKDRDLEFEPGTRAKMRMSSTAWPMETRVPIWNTPGIAFPARTRSNANRAEHGGAGLACEARQQPLPQTPLVEASLG